MYVDLMLIGAVLIGLAHGAWKGAAWQIAGLGALTASFLLGRPLAALIAPMLGEESTFRGFLAFAIAYGVISLAAFLLALRIRHRLKEWELEKFDRHLGAGLGAVNGVVAWSILMMFGVALSEDVRDTVLTRPSGKVLAYTLDAGHGVLPDGMHDILHPLMHPVVAGEGEATGGHEDGGHETGEHSESGEAPHNEPPPATPSPSPTPTPTPPTPPDGGHGH